jgi:hypothetical protein
MLYTVDTQAPSSVFNYNDGLEKYWLFAVRMVGAWWAHGG